MYCSSTCCSRFLNLSKLDPSKLKAQSSIPQGSHQLLQQGRPRCTSPSRKCALIWDRCTYLGTFVSEDIQSNHVTTFFVTISKWLKNGWRRGGFFKIVIEQLEVVASSDLVDRPTQLICISDIYLSTDKYKGHSRAI